MNFFKNLFKLKDFSTVNVCGLNDELYSIYIYNCFVKYNKSIFVVCNTLYEASSLKDRISNYCDCGFLFPMDDFITSEALAISPEFKTERISTIKQIVNSDKCIVITNLMGYLRYLPTLEVWNNSCISLKKNDMVSRDYLIEKLCNIGYSRESIVSETGKIGVRGYVLDIFPVCYDNPIRIEFWGDEIDSIKFFDVDSQISFENIDSIVIYPFSEFIVNNYNDCICKQKYLPFYSDSIAFIGDYLGDYIGIYYNYNEIVSSYRLLRENILEFKSFNSEVFDTNYMFDINDNLLMNPLYFSNLDNIISNDFKTNLYSYESIFCYNNDFIKLRNDIVKYLDDNKTVIFCFDDIDKYKRVVKYLELSEDYYSNNGYVLNNHINFLKLKLFDGFIFDNYVFLSEKDVFGFNNTKKKYNNSFKIGGRLSSLDSINPGDYVVHESFGVGKFDSLCTLNKSGVLKDYLKIIYLGGDSLYIPVEKIDRLSKYSGREEAAVKVDKLGTDSWSRRKASVVKRLENIAGDLIRVSAEREAMDGFAFSKDDENQIIFDNDFGYTETSDQLKAVDLIKKEMQKSKPMDMLLCGDVGYGKTEVALRAIFKAVNDGKQVAYLCPTTVLSNQQYKGALERFSKFPVRIELLNRFVDKKREKSIIEDVNNGKVDILFGTHRILSNDIKFKDLGLLVIDEEQRFGVTHKEKIKSYKANVDVLTLSATPIPRTLQMSMSGIRSLALIETPPLERYPVQTYVLQENKSVIRDAIYKEMARGGQIYFLYNYVQKIENKVNEIKELVPEARICYTHGQMDKTSLENIMMDFIHYKYDVMVCTTIIETGIDISNVNTLIICDADRFGLSQLYQIRGRVGRSNKIAYAYLMYDQGKILNDIAVKRLNTIKEFTELGSGFKIAMRDLSIRGAGDILGKDQSGFIDSIGIDLYLKLLEEAVNKAKGISVVEENDNDLINKSLIDVDTHISDEYISDDDLKIYVHKKINEVDSYDKLNDIKFELENRFGKLDESLVIYMYEEWFEKLALDLKINEIKQTKNSIECMVPSYISDKIGIDNLFILSSDICSSFRFSYKNNHVYIILDIVNLDKHFIYYYVDLLLKIKSNLD